jgi:hypothetical protein
VFKKIATVVLLAAATTAFAAPGGPPTGGGMGGPGMGGPGMRGPGARGRGRGGNVPANLGAAMRDMGQTLRKINNEYADAAQKEATLTDISTMERDIAIAKSTIPEKVNAMTGDAKTKAVADFHNDMLKLLIKFTDLEQAVLDGKTDDAKSALADIQKIETEGHKEFRDGQ